MAAWVKADRSGRCSNCSGKINEGDDIYLRGKTSLCEECGLLAASTSGARGALEQSIEFELSKLPDEAAGSMLAQAILFLARQLDSGEISSRDTANYTKELRLNMAELQSQFPPDEEEDETETIRKRRERRAREAGGF